MAGPSSLRPPVPGTHLPPPRPVVSMVTASDLDSDRRARDLARMKRRATSLLLAMTVVFVIAHLLEDRWGWLGYVRATAEAAMVGALADWFAVTALFRHPLGLPIPHTAIIPRRKDQIGESLGEFIQSNFLAGPVLAEKLQSLHAARLAGEWLAQPEHARRLAANAGAVITGMTEVLRDEDVQAGLEHAVVTRLRATEAAPLVARALEVALEGGHQQALLDTALRGIDQLLDDNRDLFRARLGQQSPWWVPEPIDDRVFKKVFEGMKGFLAEVAADPDHELRHQLDTRLGDLAKRLRTDPDMIAKGEELKEELLAHPSVRAWSSSLWANLKSALVELADDPDSDLRRRIEDALLSAGRSLRDDPALQAKVDRWVAGAVEYLVDQYRHDIADLISTTVAHWDPEDTSRRIELQVGRDLQYIRINGTVVGGLAGLAIYTLAQFL